MDLYQQVIYKSRYARWLDSEERRENWDETVDRYINFFKSRHNDKDIPWGDLRSAIYNMEIMPSMRALMTAGKALDRDNVSSFNCSYVVIDTPKAFDEAMYILMCGAGVGFSVERQYINLLPEIAEEFNTTDTCISVHDSKIGWATSFREILSLLWSGKIPKWDLSKLRPQGAPLKTFGGRASGPEPLDNLFKFSVNLFVNASGRKLTSVECHDLMCKVAEVVVSGGVRRCLPKDSLVSTKYGLKKIEDIQIGDEVVTGVHKYSRVTAKENTGNKNIVTIKTQLGDLESSKDHRWATLSDLDGSILWKEAKELSREDTLMFIPEVIDGKKTTLPKWSYNKPPHSTTCKDIIIPELDTEMAWLIGQLHGDGCVQLYDRSKTDRSDSVSIACADNLIGQNERVIKNLSRFGLEVKNPIIKNENCTKPKVISKQLAIYMSQFKVSNTSINVPSFIMESTSDIRGAYVAGVLDADGSVKGRPIKIMSTIYPDFGRQIQGLLASLGIPSIFKLRRKSDYKPGWKALYELSILSNLSIAMFEDKVGIFSLKWKNDTMLIRKHEQNTYIVPKKLLKNSNYKKLFHYSYAGNNKINLSFNKFIETTGNKITYIPIKINNIETNNITKETYDISVERDECFVVNGILTHNSATISLSNLSDDRMRAAKVGQWWIENPQRSLANNSAIYTEKPDVGIFMQEWMSLYNSKSGERGIINRKAFKAQAEKTGRRNSKHEFGPNPCSEIILRPNQFCNLTEVVIRSNDDKEILLKKVELATILGTLQATLTDFRYLRKIWANNTKEESLLGVSLTGIMDNNLTNTTNITTNNLLNDLKERAIEINKKYANIMDIEQAASITCVKPSGTVSQLVNSASGIHPRFAPFYIRRVRMDKKDPICKVLSDNGIPYEDDIMNTNVSIFSFPIKSHENSIFVKDVDAITQLKHWMIYKEHWCEHNPSVTIYIKEHEWLRVGAWVFDNFDQIGGLAFLPYHGGIIPQSPYEEISETTYKELNDKMPTIIDWELLSSYERSDMTTGVQELACSSGSCEI